MCIYTDIKFILAEALNSSSPIKVSFKYFIYCQYDQAIRLRVVLFIFSGERLVDWHNHDNRLDNNNQT